MVPRRWVMAMNWVLPLMRRMYRANRVTLASSRAASISSMTQKGVGRTLRMAKYRAMATKAFSPPESREMVLRALPGGCTRISMPQFKTSSGSSSSSVALPPWNRSRKVWEKASLIRLNWLVKMAVISWVMPEMMSVSSLLDLAMSLRWSVK